MQTSSPHKWILNPSADELHRIKQREYENILLRAPEELSMLSEGLVGLWIE